LDKSFIEQELKIFAKEQSILLMQDNDENINTLKNTLDKFFKSVVVVKNKKDAQKSLIEYKFDIVIVSVDFENKYGGLKAIKMVRDRNENQVIMMSGDISSNLDTDMFIELLEMRVATFIPHLLSIEFVMMKIMEQSEKIVYSKVELSNKIEAKTKAKEEKKEKIKSKKSDTNISKQYIENLENIEKTQKEVVQTAVVNQISAIDFIEELAKKDNFRLLKYTIDNLNDLYYDFEKLIYNFVYSSDGISQKMKDDLVDILFDYEDSLMKLNKFDKLAEMFGTLGYFIDSIPIEQVNNKSFQIMWYLNDDLRKLVQHVFVKKDVANIHFLDESIVSSLQQLKDNFNKCNIDSSDQDEIELF
jgi:CheY-like chemotaxis protein